MVVYVFAAVLGVMVGMAGAVVTAVPALAQECPGNPDALGTSRVLVLRPGELMRVGSMQYPQTLPLADKEVVLTFDDGPLPPYSNRVLDILAAQCVKATFFLVGRMAQSFPATARRIYAEGHAIGTHSEDHPLRMQKLPIDKIRWEIDQGIADVAAALGDSKELAPFFRIPGFARSTMIEDELAARSLIVFSSDTVADDWHRHIKPGDIISRAMKRLEARGRGILLLHDIHPGTVMALPGLLKELKEKGFQVVQVVPPPIETVSGPTLLTKGPTTPLPGDRTDGGWPKVLPAPPRPSADLPAPDVPSAATERPDPSATAAPADHTQLPAPSVKDMGVAEWWFAPPAHAVVQQASRSSKRTGRHHVRSGAPAAGYVPSREPRSGKG
jgi:peptidoglycan-N-acetylglucosamine deacetylase